MFTRPIQKMEEEKENKVGRRVELEYLEEYLAYYLCHADVLVFWMD